MMRIKTLGFLSIAAAMAWPTSAIAHPGHGAAPFSFFSGMMHPLTGFDHLAAMLMVGLWAGTALPGRAWAPPVAFVSFMLAGFAYGLGGGEFPAAEGAILASVVVLGLAICFMARAPIAVAATLIGLFAFAHGYAHGAELPRNAAVWPFAAGFALTTTSLHLVGLAAARLANRPTAQALGAIGAAGGVWMLLAS